MVEFSIDIENDVRYRFDAENEKDEEIFRKVASGYSHENISLTVLLKILLYKEIGIENYDGYCDIRDLAKTTLKSFRISHVYKISGKYSTCYLYVPVIDYTWINNKSKLRKWIKMVTKTVVKTYNKVSKERVMRVKV